jgi:hypothetical protein
VEKSQAPSNPSPGFQSENEVTFDRAQAWQDMMARIERDRQEAERKRRAGRPKGELTQSLKDKLRNCNVAQLERVKKVCDWHIKRQSSPPTDYDCAAKYTRLVLSSVTVKAWRYRLEFRRTTLRANRVYVNGPYIFRYWWDGSIVKSEYFKKGKNLRRELPKKVWLTFRDLLDRPENADICRELTEKLEAEMAAEA